MVTRTATSSLCRSCRRRLLTQQTRTLSSTTSQSLPPPYKSPQAAPSSRVYDRLFNKTPASDPQPNAPSSARTPTTTTSSSAVADIFKQVSQNSNAQSAIYANQPYHLNIFAHKHNTHLTFTSPTFSPILSFSCGQLGLRKAQRGSFDAAYNLCVFVFGKMRTSQWRHGGKKMTMNPMRTLQAVGTRDGGGSGIEVVLRGYGPGREAFQKALLGQEGRDINQLVSKVTDGTRLKFGGTRSPAVRRLG